jgi:hypothetical protein
VADLSPLKVASGFAYSVRVIDDAERRTEPRRRTRLRSGKILDLRNEFLIECQVLDRSEMGARVRLYADIPSQSLIRLYEDKPERLLDAYIVWRRDFDVGLGFNRVSGARRLTRIQLICLRSHFYAIES